MKNLIILLFILLNYLLVNCLEKFKNNEVNTFFEELVKKGKRMHVRAYSEALDPVVFVDLDMFILRPFKLVSYDAYLTELYNKWDEEKLIENVQTSFVFSNMTEIVGNRLVESNTNLRRFLIEKDQFKSETNIEFITPLFLRNFDYPSILGCIDVKEKLKSFKMEYYLNHNKFMVNKKSNYDQFFCILKGGMEIAMINNTALENFLLEKEKDNLDEDILKNIEFLRVSLETGHCLYVPNSCTSNFRSYSIISNSTWFYKVQWEHFQKQVTDEECFGNDMNLNETKFLDYDFESDKNEDSLKKNIEFVSYFGKYLDFKKALSKFDFVEYLKMDETVIKTLKNCDHACVDIAKKIFDLLDIDGDGLFSAQDILNFDEQSLNEKNSKIHNLVENFHDIVRGQLDKLKNTIDQLKDLGKTRKNTNHIIDILKQKLHEWLNNLSPEEKLKYQDININTIVDQLMGSGEDAQTEKRNKKKSLRKPEEKHRIDSSYDETNLNEKLKENIKIIDDDRVDEIDADEEIPTTKIEKIEL